MIHSCNAVAPPVSLTQDEMKNWRTRLNDYVASTGAGDAEAWGCLADAYASDALNRWNEGNDIAAKPKLLAEADNAIQNSVTLATNQGIPIPSVTHYATGMILRARGDHDAALTAFQSAYDEGQNVARYAAQYANQLINVGRAADAVPLIGFAIDTGSSIFGQGDLSLAVFHWILGRAFFFGTSPDYVQAITWLRKSVHDETTGRDNLWFNRLYLISAYALSGDLDSARTERDLFDAAFQNFKPDTLRSYEKDIPPSPNLSLANFHKGLSLVNFWPFPL